MPRALPIEIRHAAIERVTSGESVRSVAKAIGATPHTVSSWLARFQATGDVKILRAGNPKLTPLPDHVKAEIISYRATRPDATASEILAAMRERHGIKTSTTYINRLLRNNQVAAPAIAASLTPEDHELAAAWLREDPKLTAKKLRQRYRRHYHRHLDGRLAIELLEETRRAARSRIEESELLAVIRAYRYRAANDIVDEIRRRHGIGIAAKTIRRLRAMHNLEQLDWTRENPAAWCIKRLEEQPHLTSQDLRDELLTVWNVKAKMAAIETRMREARAPRRLADADPAAETPLEWCIQRLAANQHLSNRDLKDDLLKTWNVKATIGEIETMVRSVCRDRGLLNPLLKGKLSTRITLAILDRPDDAARDIRGFIDRVCGAPQDPHHVDAFLAHAGLLRFKEPFPGNMPRTTATAEDSDWLRACLASSDCSMRSAAIALLASRHVAISPARLYRALGR